LTHCAAGKGKEVRTELMDKEKEKKLSEMEIHAAAGAVTGALTGLSKGDEEAKTHRGSYSSAPAKAQFPSSDDSGYVSTADRLGSLMGSRPQYSSRYEGQLSDLYDSIANRDPFDYNASDDPLYLQYRDRYSMDGQLAMRDSMGQAAALTGGYGSSYSQAAGQQQYNEYMRGLTDMLPELYKQAYAEYQDEGDWLMRQYGLLDGREQSDYERYRDSVSDWKDQQDLDLKLRDQAYDRLLYLMQNSRYMPSDKQLEDAGLTRKQAEELYRSLYL